MQGCDCRGEDREAMPQPRGIRPSPPTCRAALDSAPTRFAKVTSLSFSPVAGAALDLALMASANFSHTRGTPKNIVGRTALSVRGSDPLRASGRPNQTVWLRPRTAALWMGKATSAAWRGRAGEACRDGLQPGGAHWPLERSWCKTLVYKWALVLKS